MARHKLNITYLRYDSARDCGGSGFGGVVDGYVAGACILATSRFFVLMRTPPTSAERRGVLVGSLREVIAKQATEIESLRNKLNELTANSLAAAAAATASQQSAAKFDEVSYSISTFS
jgi:hypothetical protein